MCCRRRPSFLGLLQSSPPPLAGPTISIRCTNTPRDPGGCPPNTQLLPGYKSSFRRRTEGQMGSAERQQCTRWQCGGGRGQALGRGGRAGAGGRQGRPAQSQGLISLLGFALLTQTSRPHFWFCTGLRRGLARVATGEPTARQIVEMTHAFSHVSSRRLAPRLASCGQLPARARPNHRPCRARRLHPSPHHRAVFTLFFGS